MVIICFMSAGQIAYVTFCMAFTYAVLWLFAVHVARPFSSWVGPYLGHWTLLMVPLLLLGWWWAMRREQRLIAEGRLDPPVSLHSPVKHRKLIIGAFGLFMTIVISAIIYSGK